MGLFGKSEAQKQKKRIESLVTTALNNMQISHEALTPEYLAAMDALRREGPAAEEYMLAVASAGPPFPKNMMLWQAIFDMGESVVPGVVRVMKNSPSESARAQAVMTLGTFAETASPSIRHVCLQEVRWAAARDDDMVLQKVAEEMLGILADHGSI